MHGIGKDLVHIKAISQAARHLTIETIMCVPATLLHRAKEIGVSLGGQTCHAAPYGAHTGDISAPMLRDAGADYVILGHSERRTDHSESDANIAAKTQAAWQAGLTVILCIGETVADHRAGRTQGVLSGQIEGSLPSGAAAANTILAYEPIWAIGTGRTPSLDDIQTVHAAVRAQLPDPMIPIIYGGSVTPSNAPDIFALEDVDGGLVGGASLRAQDFIPILQHLEETVL